MRDSDVDLYTFERLRDQFGPFAGQRQTTVWGVPSGNSMARAIARYSGELTAIVTTTGRSIWSIACSKVFSSTAASGWQDGHGQTLDLRAVPQLRR